MSTRSETPELSCPSKNTLSIKVKYVRERSPTEDNPLDGLFDYSQLGRILEETLPAYDPDKSIVDLENTLVGELKRQGIHNGKYKLSTKPTSETKTIERNEKIVRISGFVDDVAINHEHFLDNQKLSETGNSVENLDWVIKLTPSDQTASTKFETAFQNQEFQIEVATIIKYGLAQGDALELVNEAIKKIVQKRLDHVDASSNKIVFALKRRGVLKSAVVVIGETHMIGEQPSKPTDRLRKYHDF